MAKQPSCIDFDYWSQLARDDPERFESLRSATLESHINKAPEAQQNRLRCLQWRVDRMREKAKTPMAACINISNMMWDSAQHLVISCKHLEHIHKGQDSHLPSATILKFVPRLS